MLMLDPFRQLDRLAEQVLGTVARPAAMPMDAWREGDEYVVAFDLPGVEVDSIDLGVEHNVLTVRAERKAPVGKALSCVRPSGPGASSAGSWSSVTHWRRRRSKPTTTRAS
jgi:HSP20 family protein